MLHGMMKLNQFEKIAVTYRRVSMETKWFAILFITFFIAMAAVGAIGEYSKNQCRIEAMKALQDPALINQICK